jgi:hypothetical protein
MTHHQSRNNAFQHKKARSFTIKRGEGGRCEERQLVCAKDFK